MCITAQIKLYRSRKSVFQKVIWILEKDFTLLHLNEELQYYKMNNQICIPNQIVLEKILTFKKSYAVETEGAR